MSDEEELMKAVREVAEKRGIPTPGLPATPEALPIDWSTEPTPAHANGAQVVHGPQHFALLFTDMVQFPGRNAPENAVGQERARVVASLRMDPSTYFQMLAVLTSNWNRYVEAHVPKQMRQPRFKLVDAGDTQLYGFEPPKDD